MQPVIAIHGGAGDIPDALVAGHESGVRRAAEIGLEMLERRGTAEDAVEAAVRYLEDDETFDAGRGSFLNQDGEIELDAAFMEGRTLEAGAIAGVRDIANPISLARLVMLSEQVFIIGEGTSRFAEQHGMQRCSRERLLVPRELEFWHTLNGSVKGDTVGAVAMDCRGHLAAGTSTGGRPFKLPGRVGDVPCIGSGLYADDQLGATSSTGEGELIMRIVMAKWAVDHLAGGRDPQQVTRETIQHLNAKVKGEGGLVLIDRLGRVGCSFNTRRMSRAWNVGTQIYAKVEP
jgi:beta-aspartyl-peptidase (threonine type)